MRLRKAKNGDVPQIRALINSMAERVGEGHRFGHMLPRSLTELYEHIRDYTVLADENNRVLGCCALESQWDGLAELKALAVHDDVQGQGWGRNLVEVVLAESENLGVDCVYTLTNKVDFFKKLGFSIIDMRELPQRVWTECTNCPKFMVACDEVAMTYGGCKPRQTFIPAIGKFAPPSARAELGLSTEVSSDENIAQEQPPGPMNPKGFNPPFAPRDGK
jgi:amino-acid N-acetyltransferase